MMMSSPALSPDSSPALSPDQSPVQSARLLLKELKEQFAVFRECKPLAIGIDKQLMTSLLTLNRKALRSALGIHTNSLQYLKVMEKATVRFDLEGNTADEITDAHRTHATDVLRERFKKNAAHRKAQRDAEEAQRKVAEAQRKVEEADRQRSEKLSQLTAKFSRHGS